MGSSCGGSCAGSGGGSGAASWGPWSPAGWSFSVSATWLFIAAISEVAEEWPTEFGCMGRQCMVSNVGFQ